MKSNVTRLAIDKTQCPLWHGSDAEIPETRVSSWQRMKYIVSGVLKFSRRYGIPADNYTKQIEVTGFTGGREGTP